MILERRMLRLVMIRVQVCALRLEALLAAIDELEAQTFWFSRSEK